MYILYTIIAIVIIFIVLSTIIRKNIYKEVDRLEEWKNKIMNEPIPDEIGKVKQLQMSGETEEKFETWRDEWDDIVGVIIPNIGESLFDIEDYVSKYRFSKAKNLIAVTNQRLKGIDEQLVRITNEIEQLVESEKQNRTEIEGVREQFRSLTTDLLKRRGTLGSGVQTFDEKVAEVNELLQHFDHATDEGSYLQARENLLEATEMIEETREVLHKYPQVLITLEKTIPNELSSLQDGIKEMEEEGYYLEEFEFDGKIHAYKEELALLHEDMLALQCDKVEQRLDELTEEIDHLYDVLEEEVVAKQYIITELPMLQDELKLIEEKLAQLEEETLFVERNYHVPKEQHEVQKNIRDATVNLSKQLVVFENVSEEGKQTFTTIREMVDEWKTKLEGLNEQLEAEKETLAKMREDELKAKETLRKLRERLLETKRLIERSNVPNLSVESFTQLEETEKKMQEAMNQVEQIPLELGRIAVLVDEATESVEASYQYVSDVIETAELAEKVIQFGNRYRSRSIEVERGLRDAEQLFRQAKYEDALTQAVTVVHPFEPNVVERVSQL